jgi:hypothetical protein
MEEVKKAFLMKKPKHFHIENLEGEGEGSPSLFRC